MSAASTSPKSKVDETLRDIGVQTVIKVYPFILPPSTGRASVTSDKKFCTVLSLETSTESSKFYNLLQYTPYHDIEENNLRVLNLPRKTKLQWVTNKFSEETLKAVSLADDDGIGQVCDDLLLRLRTGKKTQWTEAGTQTDLAVRPFLVEDPEVARVYCNVGVQVTWIGCKKSSGRASATSYSSSNST